MVISNTSDVEFPKDEYSCSVRMPPGENVIACAIFLPFCWQTTLNTGVFAWPEA